MNLWTAANGAETMAKTGDKNNAKFLISWAEAILERFRKSPTGSHSNPPAICCFGVEKGGIIYCDKIVIHPDGKKEDLGRLFPGKLEERRESCRACRQECETKIAALKKTLKK